jgi:hypothetical protein
MTTTRTPSGDIIDRPFRGNAAALAHRRRVEHHAEALALALKVRDQRVIAIRSSVVAGL